MKWGLFFDEQAALSHVVSPRARRGVCVVHARGSLRRPSGPSSAARSRRRSKSLVTPVESYVRWWSPTLRWESYWLSCLPTLFVCRSAPDCRGNGSPTMVAAAFESRALARRAKAFEPVRSGFVCRRVRVQSFAAYWFYLRFRVRPAALGAIFFWANLCGNLGSLGFPAASRIGLIRTMVFTHLPSNVLLFLCR